MSPAVLFKHLLKLTLFFFLLFPLQCQQSENDPSGNATELRTPWKPECRQGKWGYGGGKREADRERKREGITVGVAALLTSAPGLAS